MPSFGADSMEKVHFSHYYPSREICWCLLWPDHSCEMKRLIAIWFFGLSASFDAQRIERFPEYYPHLSDWALGYSSSDEWYIWPIRTYALWIPRYFLPMLDWRLSSIRHRPRWNLPFDGRPFPLELATWSRCGPFPVREFIFWNLADWLLGAHFKEPKAKDAQNFRRPLALRPLHPWWLIAERFLPQPRDFQDYSCWLELTRRWLVFDNNIELQWLQYDPFDAAGPRNQRASISQFSFQKCFFITLDAWIRTTYPSCSSSAIFLVARMLGFLLQLVKWNETAGLSLKFRTRFDLRACSPSFTG